VETTEAKVSKYGKSLVTNLFILVRMTGMYQAINEAIMHAAKRLLSDITTLLDETGEFTLKVIEGSFYIEGIRVKAAMSDVENFTSLAQELEKRSVGVLDFVSPLTAEDLIQLAYAIRGAAAASEIQSKLEGGLIKSVAIGGTVFLQKEEGLDLKDRRAVAKRAYVKAVAALIEMDNAVKTGKRVKLKKIKRALQLIVDCLLLDDTHLVSFTTTHPDNYYYYHPVNVAVLAVVLGKQLGLNRVHLRTLAVTSFFHDLGKVEIPMSILNKKSDYTAKERELLERHPLDSIKVLLRTFGLNESSILSMLVSFEHHMKLDLSGYPVVSGPRRLNLFSRIVSLADDYDALVSGRVDDRKKLSREDALYALRSASGRLYDPVMVNAFIGIFC